MHELTNLTVSGERDQDREHRLASLKMAEVKMIDRRTRVSPAHPRDSLPPPSQSEMKAPSCLGGRETWPENFKKEWVKRFRFAEIHRTSPTAHTQHTYTHKHIHNTHSHTNRKHTHTYTHKHTQTHTHTNTYKQTNTHITQKHTYIRSWST